MLTNNKPDIKLIKSLAGLPDLPGDKEYAFRPALTLDAARGICKTYGAQQGFFLKNRVYFVKGKPA